MAYGSSFRYADGMISVFIQADSDPVALSRTLAALVPGAVEGLVREAVVVTAPDEKGADGVRRVAEHAGCQLVDEAELASAIAAARGEWLLLMRAGARPTSGWVDAVSQHFEGEAEGAAADAFRFRVPGKDTPLLARLLRRGPDALSRGVLMRRRAAVARCGGLVGLKDLAGAVRTHPIAAEMRPAPRA